MIKAILKSFILIIFAFQFSHKLFANTDRDSLLNLLNKHKRDDTIKVDLLIDVAWTYWYNTNQSLPYIEEALSLSEKLSYTKGIVLSKYRYIKYFIDKGKIDTINSIANEILDLSKTKKYEQGVCLAWLSFMEYHFWSGNYKSSIKYFEKVKSACIGINDKYILCIAGIFAGADYAILGKKNKTEECINYTKPYFDKLKNNSEILEYLYFKLQLYTVAANNAEKSNETYIVLRDNLRELSDLEGEAYVQLKKGSLNYQLGNYIEYLESNYLAFEIFQEIENIDGIARSTENLCLIYYLLKDYEKSKFYGLQSLKLCKELNRKKSIVNNFYKLGLVYAEQDSLKKAQVYFTKSLELSIETNNDIRVGWPYIGLARIADKRSQFNKAFGYYQKAMQFKDIVGQQDISYFYSSLANHFLLTKDYSNALLYADSAFIISKELDAPDMMNKVTEVLYTTYAINEDYQLAYKYLIMHRNLSEGIKINEAIQLGQVNEFENANRKKEIIQEQKNLFKEQELKQQKKIRNIFAAGIGIVILLSILIIRNYRQKQKVNRLLTKQKEEIQEINKDLVKQKEEIQYKNDELNQRNEEIISQRDEIEVQRNIAIEQKDQIHNQSKSIRDSIKYAERIQSAMLPPEAYIHEILHENFILYKPRDVVSGDFYWFKQVNQYIIIVAADSTGHGIPGAFMSMLGVSFLNEIVQQREITEANQIINELRRKIKHSLRQHGKKDDTKDGMDIAICVLDTKTSIMQYAGAYNPLYVIKYKDGESELVEIKADRMPVGIYFGREHSFTNHEIQLEIGDTFYIFTDGYADQIGGNLKKFMTKNFKKLLLDIQKDSMIEQKEILENKLSEWMGNEPQIDDILVIGVRIE